MTGVVRRFRSFDLEADRPVSTATLSRDGSMIAVAVGTAIDLFDVATGESKRRIIADAAVTGLALSSDNRLLAAATGAPTVRVYQCQSGKIVQKLLRTTVPTFLRKQPQMQVAFFGKTKMLITRGDDSDVTIWNCETGAWEHLFRMPHLNAICAVSPGGRHFAMVGEPNPRHYTGQVTMYRMNQGPEHRWNRHHANDKRVTAASFSLDGSRLATCGAGDGIRVWKVETGEPMFEMPERAGEPFIGALFVADKDCLLTIQSRTLAKYRLGKEQPQLLSNITLPRRISGFCGSGDGRLMATYDTKPRIDAWKISDAP
jgi:WD40 repeat protein